MIVAQMVMFLLCVDVNPNDPFVAAINTAYDANRSTLSYGSAHFTFTIGRSVANGFYAYDGTNARYDLLVSVEDLIADRVKTGPNSWATGPVRSYRLLTDGQATLEDTHFPNNDGILTYQAQIEAGADQFSRNLLFPLDLGNPRPGDWHVSKDIELARKGSGAWKLESLDEHAKLDTTNVVLLTFSDKGFRRQYWLDLAKSAVPVRIVDTADAGGRIQIDYGDIRWVGNKGWLPFRYTIQTGSLAKELVVQTADFEARPSTAVFQLEFPEALKIVDVGRKLLYDPKQVWDLSDLAGRSSARSTPIGIPDPLPAAPVMPGERTRVIPWVTALVVCGIVLLGSGAIVFWRRRNAF